MAKPIGKLWEFVQLFLSFIDLTETGNDKGINVSGGQLSVGTRTNGYETCLGGGDSFPPEIGTDFVFHCDISNTSGNIITSAIDTTEIVASETDSSVGMFNGTTAGKYVLIGIPTSYYGKKITYESLGSVDPENIVLESYKLGVWNEEKFMTTNSDIPYTKYGWNLAQNLSEQILYGFDPIDTLSNTWSLQTLNINGVDITKYWGRLRITSNIVEDPIVQQIKIHSNRTEIEDTGFLRSYGYGRKRKTLQGGINLSVKNDLSDPTNEVVDYTSNYHADLTENELVGSGATDGFGYIQNIEFGVDTSIDLILGISYYVKGTNTGDIQFEIESTQVSDGFIYDGSYGDTVSDEQTVIENITTNSNLVRKSFEVKIPINKLVQGDGVVINVRRVSGAAGDTLTNSVVTTNVVIDGYYWN